MGDRDLARAVAGRPDAPIFDPVDFVGEAGVEGDGSRNDPAADYTSAVLHQEELESYRGLPLTEKLILPLGDGLIFTQTTVGERLKELPALIRRDYERALLGSEAKNFVKAAELLSDVGQAIRQKEKEHPSFNANMIGGRKLDTFSLPELLLLQGKLENLIQAPRIVREQYAGFLAEEGELARADKLLKESLLYGGSRAYRLHEEVELRLMRQTLAGGTDPLEMARLASRELRLGTHERADELFTKARAQAEKLDRSQLADRQGEIQTTLSSGKVNDPQRIAALNMELVALGELKHAPAAVDFSHVQLKVSRGRYGEAQAMLSRAALLDPEFVADRQSLYLDLSTIARSEGRAGSDFAFHDELTTFQRLLSPNKFDAQEAKAALMRAQEAVKDLPVEEILQVKKVKAAKAIELEATVEKERNADKKQELKNQLEGVKLELEGLELLAHAPAYCKLMEGIFELAQRRPNEAKAIFDKVEEMDPVYSMKASTQITELRMMADLPETAKVQQSVTRSLIRELGYSLAALGAGALVVVATGWSGPAALAAGFATGAAVRSGLKYAVEGELEWYDPLIGGLDGFSGGAGAMVRRSALTGLSNSWRTVGSAERALQATGLDANLIHGLQGADRINRARAVSGAALREMGKELTWLQRSRFFGDPAYLQARAAVGQLGRAAGKNLLMAEAAGAATTSLLFRGRQYAPLAIDGSFDSFGDLAGKYSSDVGQDIVFAGVGSHLLAPWRGLTGRMPVLYGGRDLFAKEPIHQARLKEIDALLKDLDMPSSPKQVREWYLKLPGPKVELLPQH